MAIEIKVFLLTRYLYVLYQEEELVLIQLKDILGHSKFWERWIERYHQISDSTVTQIMLLREAGYTYRDIQQLLKVSPQSVQNAVNGFKLNYDPLPYSKQLEKPIKLIEIRMEKGGIQIW